MTFIRTIVATAGLSAFGFSVAPAVLAQTEPRGSDRADGLTSQLLDRVQTLEDQLRSLRGQLDELQNESERRQATLAKQVSDLSFQLNNNSGHATAQLAATSLPSGNLAAQGPGALGETSVPMPPRRTPETALQEGRAALARRDYAAAEAVAREVLAGRSPRAYDAQFLLAQAQAGQGNFQGAALSFDDSYSRNKAGSHAQDSLAGLASALLSLGDKGAACGALNRLRSSFPALRPDVRDEASAMRGRAGCG